MSFLHSIKQLTTQVALNLLCLLECVSDLFFLYCFKLEFSEDLHSCLFCRSIFNHNLRLVAIVNVASMQLQCKETFMVFSCLFSSSLFLTRLVKASENLFHKIRDFIYFLL